MRKPEWQGLYIHCSGVQSGEIEFEGRITDITHKYIPGLVRDAEKKLGELQRRISAWRNSGMGQKGKLMRNQTTKKGTRRLRLPSEAKIKERESKTLFNSNLTL